MMRLWLFLFSLYVLPPGRAAESISLVAEDDWYPYSGVVENQAQGMAVDIVRAAYAAVGVTVTLKSLPYSRCLRDVKDGNEIGCFDSLKDPKLAPLYLFHHEPLFFAEISIYALQTSTVEMHPHDLVGKKVSLTNGYTYGEEIESTLNLDRDIANSDLFNLRKTIAHHTDYSLVYTRVFDYLLSVNPDLKALHRVGQVTRDPLYVSFSLKHTKAAWAAQKLDEGLRLIHHNGQYKKIENDWTTRLHGN